MSQAPTDPGLSARVRGADGLELHAESHGAGPPLLFSCPLNTTCENWRPQVAALVAAGRRAILWDYRGHGRSDAPDDPSRYSMDRVVDDLGRVLDWAAPDEAVTLAGLSFGGLASLHFTLRRPERVRALVLIGSGPGFKNPEARAQWAAACERTSSYLEAKGLDAFVASRAVATLVGNRPDTEAARHALAAIARQSARGLAHFGRRVAAQADPVIDELASIEQPALVLVGELDRDYRRAAELMHSRLPRAELCVLEGLGHIVNLEDPARFDAALLDFLGRAVRQPALNDPADPFGPAAGSLG